MENTPSVTQGDVGVATIRRQVDGVIAASLALADLVTALHKKIEALSAEVAALRGGAEPTRVPDELGAQSLHPAPRRELQEESELVFQRAERHGCRADVGLPGQVRQVQRAAIEAAIVVVARSDGEVGHAVVVEVPERREAFRDYQRRTSVWLPWPPG